MLGGSIGRGHDPRAMATPRPREEYTDAQLADLVGHWLEVHCGGCRNKGYWPCPLLARERRLVASRARAPASEPRQLRATRRPFCASVAVS